MSRDQIDRAAGFILYVIGGLMLLAGFGIVLGGVGCAGGTFLPDFCSQDAVAARRVFFLEVLGGLVAVWAGLKMVEGR